MKKLFIVLFVIVGVIGTGYFWLTSPTETAKSIIRTRFADPSQISFKSSAVLWSGKDESEDRITNGFPAFVVRVDFEQPNGLGRFDNSCYLVSFANDAKHGQSNIKLNAYGSFNPCDSEWLKNHNLTEKQALQNEINRFARR